MNTRFPFVVGVTLCANNTDDYEITATTTFSDDPNGATGYVDGVEYHVFVRYPDNSTSGHEEVWGAYNATTNRIARTRVGKSSAGYGVKVNWGSSAPKHIAAVVSGAELGNMASVLIDLEPWEDLLIGGTMQSNGGRVLYYAGSPPPDTDRVVDWSRAVPGTGGAGTEAWLPVVKADHYTDYNDSLCHIGTTRSVLDTTWKATGSIIHALATRLSIFMGRKARTVSVHRGATSFNDPTKGWGYLPSESDAVSKVFADAVDAAIAQMHTDDPRQSTVTKLHIYLIVQGENDASLNDPLTPYFASPSAKWGRLVAQHISDLERSDRWNIINDKTRILLFDIPESLRKKEAYQVSNVNQFDGHAQAAALIGPRAIVVPTIGIPTQADRIHYTGEGADLLGYGGGDLLLANTSPGNTGGAFRQVKNLSWPIPAYVWQSDSAAAPSSGSARLNVAQTEIKIHKTAAGSVDAEALGLGLFEIGDILRFEKQGDAAIYIDTLLTGTAVDNTTYFSYACTTTIVGTVTGINIFLKPQNTGFFDGSFSAVTQHNIQSIKQNLANVDVLYTKGAAVTLASEAYRNNHVLMLNEQGRQYRSAKLGPRWGKLRTTDATANQKILRSYHFEDGRVEYLKATVCYKVPANGNVGIFTLQAVVRRTGSGAGATVIDGTIAVVVVIDEEALATDPSIVAASFFGLAEGYEVWVTGKAATTIDWVCELETIEIPTGT